MKKSRTRHKVIPAKKTAESVSALASGMADDFNNILTTVMGACSLIDKDDPENEALIQYVSLIRTSAEHAASLSGRLMHAGADVLDTPEFPVNPASLRDKGPKNNTVVTENNSGDDSL